jgi:hypothetical protein
MRTDCIVKLSKLQISKLNTLVQKETSGDVEGNYLLRTGSKKGFLSIITYYVKANSKLCDLPITLP